MYSEHKLSNGTRVILAPLKETKAVMALLNLSTIPLTSIYAFVILILLISLPSW